MIPLSPQTRVIVQGITGRHGSFHTKQMLEFGTKIVAGVTPGKKGEKICGIPVYNTVEEAIQSHPADISVLFVPAVHAREAALEALENMLHLVIVTEHIPIHDMIDIVSRAHELHRVVIGPNSPGICAPGQCKIGVMPNSIFGKLQKHGQLNVGIVSRSGTLMYEIVDQLTENEIGQSTVIGIGGDPIIGMEFIPVLAFFEKDPTTAAIILTGEMGGTAEEKAAEYIKTNVKKPVIALIAGRTCPTGKTMGHAGAIISPNGVGGAFAKIEALRKVGVHVVERPSEIVHLLHTIFQNINVTK